MGVLGAEQVAQAASEAGVRRRGESGRDRWGKVSVSGFGDDGDDDALRVEREAPMTGRSQSMASSVSWSMGKMRCMVPRPAAQVRQVPGFEARGPGRAEWGNQVDGSLAHGLTVVGAVRAGCAMKGS